MPDFVAKFNIIDITEGIANPSAQGQLATNMPTAFYITKHVEQFSIMTIFVNSKKLQTIISIKAIKITNLTNLSAILLHID